MSDQDIKLLAFNRGVISKLGLARMDLKRFAMSAEIQSNFISRVLGSMMLRPGFEFIANTRTNDLARLLPFTFSVDDTVSLELTDGLMRVLIDDQFLDITTIATAVGNDDFTSGTIAPWTDDSDTGGPITYSGVGRIQLKGDGTDFARIRQQVTVAGGDQGVEHFLRVFLFEGDIAFKVGSTAGGDEYVSETRLGRGQHVLAFTPTGDFYIDIANEETANIDLRDVDIHTVGGSGFWEIQTPWDEADLQHLRWDQSGDVIYLSCQDDDSGISDFIPTHKIERRGTGRSWSIVAYEPKDGPFRVQNTSGITLTPSALFGDITITASQNFFNANHEVTDLQFGNYGALIRIASNGQTVSKAISSADDWTDPIRVIGAENGRVFQIVLTGTWVATVKLQFAFTPDGPWNDTDQSWTANVDTTYDDGQEDSIIYYRVGVDTGDYTSGTVTATLVYANGSIQGIAKITNVASAVSVSARVLKTFGSLDPSHDWWEGAWSHHRGYPTATSIHEGRSWWAGVDKIWGSISDAFESFDDEVVGDSGTISRSIGFGPHRIIHWLMSMGRLMFGTADNSASIAPAKMDGNNPLGARSNSFDEPLSPSNFNIKTVSSKAVFVDRTKQRLYELIYNLDNQDYQSSDLSVFAPDFNEVGITQIAVQMKPDIRVHCVRSDGTVGMLVYDRLENVICWIDIDSTGAGGLIEDVSVLPGVVEDQVYYVVKRTINAATQRHICKWALESEAIGGNVNKIADSFAHYSGAATTTPFTTELLHLVGETVVIWADGKDIGTDIVAAGGALTLATAASEVVAGLGYTAQFKSVKLGDLDGIGILERKKVLRIGFLARYLHYQGLQYGPDFDNLSDLPGVEKGQVQADDTIYEDYHEDNFPFGGDWETDARICLQAAAPRPCTILAALADLQSVEKTTTRR